MQTRTKHSAKILADSLSPAGVRLTTFEIVFPRIVLAEFNTHRVFSRNSASSRAIPIKKMIQMVMDNPYIPSEWGKNQKGMQAGEELSLMQQQDAASGWLAARDAAVRWVECIRDIGVHKQWANRLLEPFMWHTVIVTATEWSNFFHLRDNEMAHPDIQKVAYLMRELYESHEPDELGVDEWHLPLIDSSDWSAQPCVAGDVEDMIKISVGRCARVSYLTHDGKRDHQADIKLHDHLLEAGHLSPFEHVARPVDPGELGFCDGEPKHYFSGNFRGWIQYRKMIPGEHDILAESR